MAKMAVYLENYHGQRQRVRDSTRVALLIDRGGGPQA